MKKAVILFCVLFLTACAVSQTELDIPYHKQTGPSCVQSQMLMAIRYYYPERQITQAELDERTGRESGQWTWFSQAMPVLEEEGLNAYYYSLTPYENLTPDFINQYYGEDGPLINSVTNWESLEKSIEFLKNNPNRYSHKKLEWLEIENFFKNRYVILMIIDYNTLTGQPEKSYAGHGVIITKINETHVVFHNSDLGPNQAAGKDKFIEAWNAPGTDNDAIIVKGKL